MSSVHLLEVNDGCVQCLDGGTLNEYQQKIQLLQTQNNSKKLIKKSLILLNEQNKNITESLIQKKKDYENLKSELNRKLYFIKITTDKDKILSRKIFNEHLQRKNNIQGAKKTTLMLELEDLIRTNRTLLEECKKVIDLLETTKKQYNEMVDYLYKNYKNKVCEFCDITLKLKTLNNRNY